MHRVARELAHQECGWKHSEGHGVVALDYEGVRHVGLDKMCLLMEVRMGSVLCLLTVSLHTLLALSCEQLAPATHEDIGVAPKLWR
jgi:hypothetical protein